MTLNNGHDATNVRSFEEARQRAAEKAKKQKRTALPDGPATMRDWLIGGVVIAMAFGLIGTLVFRAANMLGGGT